MAGSQGGPSSGAPGQVTSALNRRWIAVSASLAGAALWAAVVAMLHFSGRAGPIDGLEAALLDLRQASFGNQAPSDDVVIVAIDDATLAAAAANSEDGRKRIARLIENIGKSGARALAVDILFADPGAGDSDIGLKEALASVPSVIAAAGNFDLATETSAEMTGVLWPQLMLQTVARAGLVNISTDAGGTPRYVPLLFETDDGAHPSLTLLAAMAFTGVTPVFAQDSLLLAARRIPLDAGFNMPLRPIGPTGTIPTYSAQGLLDSTMTEALTGRLVVLGFTASAVGDQFKTAFDESMPGVEIIATAISQILGGPTLRRDARLRAWDAAVAEGLAIACTLLVLVLPLSTGVPAASGLLALWLAAVWGLFATGLWLSAALPLAAAGPPMLAACILRYARERRSAALSDRAASELMRFHDPALASKIAEDPNYLIEPIMRDLVIFFVDLTGFTGASQKLGPEGTQGFLKMYHTIVTETVEAEGGSVLNYMGDGVLAVFGLDEAAASSPADGALAAAFALEDRMAVHQEGLPASGRLACRIGLHAGPAVLSRLGADSHQQVTATGDSVNLASRLVEMAKAQQVVIAASRDFFRALEKAPARAPQRTLTVPIRGRAGAVEIVLWPSEAHSHAPQSTGGIASA